MLKGAEFQDKTFTVFMPVNAENKSFERSCENCHNYKTKKCKKCHHWSNFERK